jgi:outer membrane biosynthesis protein TonB
VVPEPTPDVKNEEILTENDSLLHNPGEKTLKGTGAPWSDGKEDSLKSIPGGPQTFTEDRPDPKRYIPGVESEPREVNMDDLRKEIGYPAKAREGKIQGVVSFRVLIDELGAYREHINISRPGTHALLVSAVEQHLKKLRCTPGIQNGKPIPMWVNVNFSFKLH